MLVHRVIQEELLSVLMDIAKVIISINTVLQTFPYLLTMQTVKYLKKIMSMDHSLQSKMYMHDVKCSDCHDSHSLKFKFEGNALCTQCHKTEEFDTYRHHFHKYKNETGNPVTNIFGEKVPVGEGVLCVNCHMPGKYYMGIDFRTRPQFKDSAS